MYIYQGADLQGKVIDRDPTYGTDYIIDTLLFTCPTLSDA